MKKERKLQNDLQNGGLSIIINNPALEQVMPCLPDQINGIVDAFWELMTRQVPKLTTKEWEFCVTAFGDLPFFELVNNVDYAQDAAFTLFPEFIPLQKKILGFSRLELMRWATELVEKYIHESNAQAKKTGKELVYPYSYRIKRHTNFHNVDFNNKGTAELSRYLGVPMAIVSRKRKHLAPDTTKKVISWDKVDWSKSDAEIKEETGVTELTVKARRKQFAPEEYRPLVTRKHIPWDKVDWSKSNEELADEFGCKILTIVQNRYKRAPEFKYKRKQKEKNNGTET